MYKLGYYNLCAPGQELYRESMFLPPSDSWLARRVQLTTARSIAKIHGHEFYFGVWKYPWGQSLGASGSAEPKFLDVLALRDRRSHGGLITGDTANLNLQLMTAFEQAAFTLGLRELFYYCGQAPSLDDQDQLSPEDWRDLVLVINSSEARFVLDSSCYPPLCEQTFRFLQQLHRYGGRAIRQRFCGEAFPFGMSSWPNQPGCFCFGEDLAYYNKGFTAFYCDDVLLYTGNRPPAHLDSQAFQSQARDLLRIGKRVALPVDVMSYGDLRSILPEPGNAQPGS